MQPLNLTLEQVRAGAARWRVEAARHRAHAEQTRYPDEADWHRHVADEYEQMAAQAETVTAGDLEHIHRVWEAVRNGEYPTLAEAEVALPRSPEEEHD